MSLPTLSNLVPSPRLGAAAVVKNRDDSAGLATGGLLVRGCKVLGSEGDGLSLRGWQEKAEGSVAPGGGRGGFRLGMQPGRTYTAAVTFALSAGLAGPRDDRRLSLSAFAEVAGNRDQIAASFRVPGEPGRYRCWVSFDVPQDATGAWLRIELGTARDAGAISLHDLSLTETPAPVPYFDGDTPADRWYTYAWSAEPGRSASVRTMTDPAGCFAADGADDVLREIERRAEGVLVSEATVLRDHLAAIVPTGSELLVAAADVLIGEASAKGASTGMDAVERRARAKDLLIETNVRLRDVVADAQDAPPAVNGLIGRRLLREYSANGALRYLQHADVESVPTGYALALAYERTREPGEMAQVLADTVARDTGAPIDVSEMLAERGWRMGARREIAAFLSPRMAHLRERADTEGLSIGDLGQSPVFVYWGQGFESAPPVVQACRRQLESLNPDRNLHFLDNRNLELYVDLPDRVRDGTAGRWAVRSDAIRLDLLARYGGTWLDATCYTTAPLSDFAAHGGSPLLAPRFTPNGIGSWLLSAPLSSYLIRLHRAAFFGWWDERDDLVDYYLFHHVFEAIARLDDRFRTEWAACPSIDPVPAHVLQHVMYDGGSAALLPELLPGSLVHKLTHSKAPDVLPLDSALAVLGRRAGMH